MAKRSGNKISPSLTIDRLAYERGVRKARAKGLSLSAYISELLLREPVYKRIDTVEDKVDWCIKVLDKLNRVLDGGKAEE